MPTKQSGMISHRVCRLNPGDLYNGSPPLRNCETNAATTEARINGPSDSTTTVPRIISATNSDAAIGALYAQAMPAADPHATRCRRCGIGILRILPTSDATSEES